jgi:hypothetical protein
MATGVEFIMHVYIGMDCMDMVCVDMVRVVDCTAIFILFGTLEVSLGGNVVVLLGVAPGFAHLPGPTCSREHSVFHCTAVKEPFVKMSAIWSFVPTNLILRLGSLLKRSINQSRSIL